MRTVRWPIFAVKLELFLPPLIGQAKYPWSGIIATSRAIDWSAGLPPMLSDGKGAPKHGKPSNWSTVCGALTSSSFPGTSSPNPFVDNTVNSASTVAVLTFE